MPAATTISTAGNQPSPKLVTSEMKTTPSSAKTEPIDRSMPPVMITKPSPIENSP